MQFEAFFTEVATFSDNRLRTSQWPSLALHFVNISQPWPLPNVNYVVNFITTLNIHRYWGQREGGFSPLLPNNGRNLMPNLVVGVRTLPLCRKEIHGYNAVSKFTSKFLWVLCDPINIYHVQHRHFLLSPPRTWKVGQYGLRDHLNDTTGANHWDWPMKYNHFFL